MTSTVFIAIDDTDEIGYPLSTGMLAERISSHISTNYAPCSFISRHQLLLDNRINYTSHNSSMCFTTQLDPIALTAIKSFILDLLLKQSAPSSSAGVAIFCHDKVVDLIDLITFGKQAKTKLLTKDEAHNVAKRYEIYLQEVQNESNGVIGALAGIALRLDGNDGKVKVNIGNKAPVYALGLMATMARSKARKNHH